MIAIDVPRCPACKEALHAPIFVCATGHSLCVECTRKFWYTVCPLCCKPMMCTRNICLENMIKEAKELCPNRAAGCQTMVAGAEITRHLEECGYRGVRCPSGAALGKCSWTGELRQLSDHFKHTHSKEFIGRAKAELELTFTTRECDRRVLLAKHQHSLFVITFKVDTVQRLAFWLIQLIGPKELAYEHLYEIHVVSKRDPLRKIVFTEYCWSDSTSPDDIFQLHNCAVLPLDLLAHYIEANQLILRYCIKQINDSKSNA